MTVAGMAMGVGMRIAAVAMVMCVRMVGHQAYSTRGRAVVQPFRALIRQYDTLPPRID
jgi:hypothetical protein